MDGKKSMTIESNSFDEMLLKLHELAMSNDKMAPAGRLAKRILVELDKWVEDERERGTHGVDMVTCAGNTAIALVGIVVNVAAKPGRTAPIMEWAKGHLVRQIDGLIEFFGKIDRKGTKTAA